ncbi:MAG: nitroreductase family protein, partial [Gammaproteobacteria bacterium]|nr:nitroreductase family protein [Gammaproteobacteria bacterium]
MELYDVMRTAFAARDFTADPVPDDVLERILDNARFAPSGGNRQGWRVIVVRDLAKRAVLGPLIEPTYRRYLAEVHAGANPWNTIAPAAVSQADIDAVAIPPGFIDRLIHAPVLLLVTVDLAVVASMDQHLPRIGVISGASIYPFV